MADSDSLETTLRYRAKVELRKRMRAVRKATPTSALDKRSSSIVERLEALPEIASANSVALFWPMVDRHEVDLRAFDSALRARGVRVNYPAIDPETRVMTFRRVDDVATMVERGLGFEEPDPAAPVATSLDAIVVPALAVDARAHRIGYGAGFYDRALASLTPRPFAVVVAFDFQLLAEVPETEGDVRCDAVVTDARTLRPTP